MTKKQIFLFFHRVDINQYPLLYESVTEFDQKMGWGRVNKDPLILRIFYFFSWFYFFSSPDPLIMLQTKMNTLRYNLSSMICLFFFIIIFFLSIAIYSMTGNRAIQLNLLLINISVLTKQLYVDWNILDKWRKVC